MRQRRTRRSDHGAAVVEFVVMVPVLLLVVLAVVQIALALYVRTTLASAAAEGARVAAVSDGAAGVRRTRAELSTSLAGGVVESVTARRSVAGGIVTIDLQVTARLPLVGLLGPSVLVVDGHALQESP